MKNVTSLSSCFYIFALSLLFSCQETDEFSKTREDSGPATRQQELQALQFDHCVPPPYDMTNWWPGDGNANDIQGNHDGIPGGGVDFPTGKVAQAFRFDGQATVIVPDDPGFTLGSRPFTIDLWVNFSRLNGRDPFIGHDEGEGEVNKWIFWYDEEGHDQLSGVPALRFHINSQDIGPIDPVVAPWNPQTGQWYHVAVTRDSSTYSLYIDGVQVAMQSNALEIPDPAFDLTIGSSEIFFLDGLIDEVEIFERALTADEIKSIYNAGSAGKCKPGTAFNVVLDIKPGSFPNTINCRNRKGVIPVAILSTATFDATTVDPLSVRFGKNGTEAKEAHNRGHIEDVNNDGKPDLVLHFRLQDSGIQCGDTTAVLTGTTRAGEIFQGIDAIQTVGEK